MADVSTFDEAVERLVPRAGTKYVDLAAELQLKQRKRRAMKTWMVAIVMAVLVGMLAGIVHAASWDNGGDGATWESGENWNPNGVPGSLGDTQTSADINNFDDASVSLTSNVTYGTLTTIRVSRHSTLTIGVGTVLDVTGVYIDGWSPIGLGGTVDLQGGSLTMPSGAILIGDYRFLTTYSNSVSTFRVSGGALDKNGLGWGNRVILGNGESETDVPRTYLFEVTDGSVDIEGDVYFRGKKNGEAIVSISGGTFAATGMLMYDGTENGVHSLLKIVGDAAGSVAITNLYAYKSSLNTNGSSVVRFEPDGTGGTPIEVTGNNTFNLGAGDDRGELEVEVAARQGNGSTGLLLVDYVGVIGGDGTFGSVTVTENSSPLTEGVKGSLTLGQYALDYADNTTGDGTAVVLYYNTTPPAGTIFIVE